MTDSLSYKINFILLFAFSLVAIYTDYRYGKIYNWLNFSVLLIGIIIAIYHHNILSSIMGIVVGFVIMFPFFASGGMGAGDVKFAMATGALVGGRLLLLAFGGAGILIFIYAIFRRMGVVKLVLRGVKDLAQMVKRSVKNVFFILKISAVTHKVFIPQKEIKYNKGDRKGKISTKIKYGFFLGFANILICIYFIITEQGGIK